MASPMEVSMSSRSGVLLDSHRHFTQSLMIKRILKKKDAKRLVKDVQTLYEDEECSFHEFVGIVNIQLEPLGFKVSLGRLERDGSEWVGLVNILNDPPSKKGSNLGLADLDFFRKCLQLMAIDEGGVVSSSALFGAVDELQRKMSKKGAQELLKTFVTDHWLTEGPKGYYSMGPRCVLELLPFLPEIVGQPVDECCLCSNYVVMGQRCSNCDIKLHLYCVKQLANTRDSVKCPQCHMDWEHDIITSSSSSS